MARSGPRGLALAGLLACCGCRAAGSAPAPEYAALARSPVQQVAHTQPVEIAVPDQPELAGAHPVEFYVNYALAQNPVLQARQAAVEAAAQRVPQAASLQDPTISVMSFPFYPNVPQTASGRMEADLTVSQEVPWFGRLRTQASVAAAEVEIARAELNAAELELVEQVRRAYYDLYFAQASIEITRQSRDIAEQLSRIAEARFVANAVSQQDLLRSQVEVANLDAELIQLDQQFIQAQARLARLLHVSPNVPLLAMQELPPEQIPQNLAALYERAVALRPELQAQLREIQREQLNVGLAQLGYYPDLALSVNWGAMTTDRALAPSADGLDNVGLGFMANIPLYRNRLRAAVREAEARRLAEAREYDSERDETLEQVKQLYAEALAQQQVLELFRTDIIPKAQLTLEVSITAYESGDIDFLQLTDNWQQVLRYRLTQQRLEAQLRQTLASLERVVGGMPAE